jgi:uncharacterized protein YodC (DUF2158 family)
MGYFNVGDLVMLKSGGPLMTCSEIDEELGVYCEWFIGIERQSGWFVPETLVLAYGNDLLPKLEEPRTMGF